MEFTDIAIISEYIQGFGPYAVLLLFALIVIQCHVPFFPFAAVSAICGFIFGFKWGVVVSWTSVVIGSTIAFYLYRYLNFDKFIEKTIKNKRHIPEEFIFGFIVVAHNIPVIPIAVANIVASLSKISMPKFIVATALGLLIPSVSFVAFGSGVESFLAKPSYWTLLLIIVILLLFYLLNKYSYDILELMRRNVFKKRNK